MGDGASGGKYGGLSREQLIALLERRDRERKLGLVWERDEIQRDLAVDADFVAATPIPDLHEKPGPWRNLVIEGDNFDALRWLRMTMAGRIKCIYVDPPYNTGNKDWVYNDAYFSKDDQYRNSTWLEFLFRRFTLARDLLTEDGVILVSINDENRAKLELMLEQALPGMRVGSFTWRTRIGGNEGGERFFSQNHEHVLVFANAGFRFSGTEKSFAMYTVPEDDPDGAWRKDNLTVAVAYTDKRAGQAFYPLQDPATGIWYPCNPDRVWVFASRERSGASTRVKTKFMEDWIKEERIIFPDEPRPVTFHSMSELLDAIRGGQVPKSGKSLLIREDLPNLDFWVGKPIGFGTPAFKRLKRELKNPTQPFSSWIVPQSEAETVESDNTAVAAFNDEGARAMKALFGEKAFNYAKPPSLIRGLIEQATSPGDIVLDFFAGSATTAQAVMELNAADGGDRRFIMVSSTEATADAPDVNICRDVTAQRIRRLNASDDPAFAELAAEFAYLRCRGVPFEELQALTSAEVWAAVEALHGLPLTTYEDGAAFQAHEGEAVKRFRQ